VSLQQRTKVICTAPSPLNSDAGRSALRRQHRAVCLPFSLRCRVSVTDEAAVLQRRRPPPPLVVRPVREEQGWTEFQITTTPLNLSLNLCRTLRIRSRAVLCAATAPAVLCSGRRLPLRVGRGNIINSAYDSSAVSSGAGLRRSWRRRGRPCSPASFRRRPRASRHWRTSSIEARERWKEVQDERDRRREEEQGPVAARIIYTKPPNSQSNIT
jgi:hypothetical protein